MRFTKSKTKREAVVPCVRRITVGGLNTAFYEIAHKAPPDELQLLGIRRRRIRRSNHLLSTFILPGPRFCGAPHAVSSDPRGDGWHPPCLCRGRHV
jgi:hypothetical protein